MKNVDEYFYNKGLYGLAFLLGIAGSWVSSCDSNYPTMSGIPCFWFFKRSYLNATSNILALLPKSVTTFSNPAMTPSNSLILDYISDFSNAHSDSLYANPLCYSCKNSKTPIQL